VDEVAELAGPLDPAAQDATRITGERLAARREDVADDPRRAPRSGPLPRDLGERAMSGIRYWSLAIRVKPSIELPSNHVPWRTEPSSWWIDRDGLDDAEDAVNWSWTNRMPRPGVLIRSAPSTSRGDHAGSGRSIRPPGR
jgi:hypothetical protein